jgi:hypothetical protein
VPSPTRVVLSALVVTGFLTAPAAARAATASVEDGFTYLRDTAGETNTVTVTQSGETFTLTDSTTPITAGAGCTQNDANQVTCSGGNNPSAVVLELGAGNDRGEASGAFETNFQVKAGPGDDILFGSDYFDALYGGGGTDEIYGRGSNDILADEDASSGESGAGPDLLDGGGGNDRADYDDRGLDQPLTLDLASPVSGQDLVTGVETIQTGPAADTLRGDGGANDFYGGGQDVSTGRGGDDDLETDGGGRLSGGTGDDTLDVDRRTGETPVNCGGGHDVARTWPTDRLRANCEDAQAGLVLIAIHRLEKVSRKRLRRGVLRFAVTCEFRVDDGTDECTGKVRLLRENGKLASTALVDVIETGHIEFELNRADRRRLRRGHLFMFMGAGEDARGFQMFLDL